MKYGLVEAVVFVAVVIWGFRVVFAEFYFIVIGRFVPEIARSRRNCQFGENERSTQFLIKANLCVWNGIKQMSFMPNASWGCNSNRSIDTMFKLCMYRNFFCCKAFGLKRCIICGEKVALARSQTGRLLRMHANIFSYFNANLNNRCVG